MYNGKQCIVSIIRDITEVNKIAKLSAENKMLGLFTSSVTHEMITPLKCISEFGKSILNSTPTTHVANEAKLIVSTSKLLLS